MLVYSLSRFLYFFKFTDASCNSFFELDVTLYPLTPLNHLSFNAYLAENLFEESTYSKFITKCLVLVGIVFHYFYLYKPSPLLILFIIS